MSMAGTNAILCVSSKFLSLVSLENNEIIAKHDMPRISFASGGDSVSLVFFFLLFRTDTKLWAVNSLILCLD